jgi:hypothetical protein
MIPRACETAASRRPCGAQGPASCAELTLDYVLAGRAIPRLHRRIVAHAALPDTRMRTHEDGHDRTVRTAAAHVALRAVHRSLNAEHAHGAAGHVALTAGPAA